MLAPPMPHTVAAGADVHPSHSCVHVCNSPVRACFSAHRVCAERAAVQVPGKDAPESRKCCGGAFSAIRVLPGLHLGGDGAGNRGGADRVQPRSHHDAELAGGQDVGLASGI